ncbi:MAG: hypothetical protein ACPG7F_00935 [Aggregatilineales bacterium]
MPEYEYQIASGWDNEAGFTNMEVLTPAAGDTIPRSTVYFIVQAAPRYNRGQSRFSATGASSFAGFATVTWTLLVVHDAAYEWFYNNYSGQNTIRTTTGVTGSYSNKNVMTSMLSPEELDAVDFGYFENVPITHRIISST